VLITPHTLTFAIDDVVAERVPETLENWTPGNMPRHRIAFPRSETAQAVSANATFEEVGHLLGLAGY
jgi:hypothetical protein